MSNIISICGVKSDINLPHISCRGLASIMRYDPYVPRCFEGIKLNLLDGHPALLRLHAGANYPTNEYRYQIDKEGQAILVVGYDDENQVFAIVDPFQRRRELPEVTWLPYEQLALTMMDTSLGEDFETRGIDINVRVLNSNLKVSIGLPLVHGTIMDHDLLSLEGLKVEVSLNFGGKEETFHHSVDGVYVIGSYATFDVALGCKVDGRLNVSITVDGLIHGRRPYEYRDAIGVDFKDFFVLEKKNWDIERFNG